MNRSVILFASDSALGRVDYSSLSDQTLMEMLVDGFLDSAKKKYQDSEGMYLDVCDWPLVRCDDNRRVIMVKHIQETAGSLSLTFMPPLVTSFFMLR